MNLRNKSLKEKVAYFAEAQRASRDMPDCFLGVENDSVARAFMKDYDETCDFIKSADADELECFISVLDVFIKKYPKEEIIRLCIERKAQVGDFYTYNFDEEIDHAKKIISDKQK